MVSASGALDGVPRRYRAVIPHLLTISRFVVVGAGYPIVYYLDHGRAAPLAVGVVLLAVGTDLLDGILARRWRTTSVLGSNLDSLADFFFYVSILLWTWEFAPDDLAALLPMILALLVLYVAALLLARWRRGAMGFHNVVTRTVATIGVSMGAATWLWGWQGWFTPVLATALGIDLVMRFVGSLRAPQGAAYTTEADR